MKSVEQKLADDIANAVESHWFNPAVIARILSNQPIYTMDRVMEMVAQIVRTIGTREEESEGVALAKELDKYIKLLQTRHNFDSLKLPSREYKMKKREEKKTHTFGWREEETNPFQ
jgi:hypothetical protein